MSRKRLTQIFPFLLPLRKWQKKQLFYFKMHMDRNTYAKATCQQLLPYTTFSTSSLLCNPNSGFDLKYQINKKHNLQLAAASINHIVIHPGETFSFWQLVRHADRKEKYKDGLTLIDNKITTAYGGGLCQLSNMLFWLFLHTPLSIVERRGHAVATMPAADKDLPCGTDAAVYEGWLDLKVQNNTTNSFQIEINFDQEYMHGRILSQTPTHISYYVYNSSVSYNKRQEKIYQTAKVCREEINQITQEKSKKLLYVNQCAVGYPLPSRIRVEERSVWNV